MNPQTFWQLYCLGLGHCYWCQGWQFWDKVEVKLVDKGGSSKDSTFCTWGKRVLIQPFSRMRWSPTGHRWYLSISGHLQKWHSCCLAKDKKFPVLVYHHNGKESKAHTTYALKSSGKLDFNHKTTFLYDLSNDLDTNAFQTESFLHLHVNSRKWAWKCFSVNLLKPPVWVFCLRPSIISLLHRASANRYTLGRGKAKCQLPGGRIFSILLSIW